MNSTLWKEFAIGQVCTGLANFVASSTLASFVAFFGERLSNPYRRLMFAQTVSEILKSLALFTGPWFPTFGSPQALWAIGNERVCQIGGFLLSMGLSGVSMYTFCLCFYFVCKLKVKMNDTVFARRFEGWMHAFIILINLIVNISALGLGTFNPSPLGNICYLFAFPPGCKQETETDGEESCDPISLLRSIIFSAINTQIIPVLCLVGGVGYLSTGICKETGISSSENDVHIATNNANEPDATSHIGYLGQITRTFDPSAFPAVIETRHEGSQMDGTNPRLVSDGDNYDENEDDTDTLRPNDSEIEPNTEPNNSFSQRRHGETNVTQSDDLSRRPTQSDYNRELAIQAILHLIVFCLTSLPFLILNAVLLRGSLPPAALIRANAYLFPLGGIFNIFVYFRPNVARLRNKHPEISRVLAFWKVFKAGGEEPNVASREIPNDQFERRVGGLISSSNSGPSVPSIIHADMSSVSNISELRHRVQSQPSPASSESLPNTNEGIVGTSSSLDSQSMSMPSETISRLSDVVKGGGSSKAHEIDERPTQHVQPNVSERPTQQVQPNVSENDRKKEMNDLWDVAFERAKNMKYDV